MAAIRCCTLLALLAAAAGCGGSEDTERANEVADEYLRAAVRGDPERLCGLRTEPALERWGGRAACERRATGLAIDPLPARVSGALRRSLRRKGLGVDPRAAEIVRDDTSVTGARARVVIDFGKAFIEDGHAVGGEIIEMDLRRDDADYRITRLGFAAYAD